MNKIISVFLLLGSTFAFAKDIPVSYQRSFSVINNTKSMVMVSYETIPSYSGSLTVLPNSATGTFSKTGEYKNIRYVLSRGKIVDETSCGFVFDQLYKNITITFDPVGLNDEGEDVALSCSMDSIG